MHARESRKICPGDRPQYSSDGKIAGLYDLDRTIGKGHFAVVKLARHVFTGEQVAVKVIDKTKLDEISKAHLFQEVRCMKLVQHPNVVRLYEVIDTATKLYLILELGDGGDMYDYIMKHKHGLREDVAKNYFRQIVTAIHYCHDLHVVHRDLKPENVVFFEKIGMVKLTDFGFSNKFVPGRKLDTSCGSLAYSAPEILLGDAYDAPAVDVWSLGVILYMLVAGEPPFQEANDSETLTMIMDCKYRPPQHVSRLCVDLVGRLLVREPGQRLSLTDILNHPWLVLAPNEPLPAPARPLVSRDQLNEDDHQHILQRMVEGKIASGDEIHRAVQEDCYNHITATYYLLAERRLRKQRDIAKQQQLLGRRRDLTTTRINGEEKPRLASLSLSPRVRMDDMADDAPVGRRLDVESLVSPPGVHPTVGGALRQCSLIQEDADDTRAVLRSRSHEDDDTKQHSSGGVGVNGGLSSRRSAPTRPLHSVKSSPQLLKEVLEEVSGESEEENDFVSNQQPPKSALSTINHSMASPELLRRSSSKKANPRGSKSCSSSDTSDTEQETERKRREKLCRFHRRDSSEHSSDTDPGSTQGASAGRTHGGNKRSRALPRQGANGDNHGNSDNKRSSGGRQSLGLRLSNGECGKVNSSSFPKAHFSIDNLMNVSQVKATSESPKLKAKHKEHHSQGVRFEASHTSTVDNLEAKENNLKKQQTSGRGYCTRSRDSRSVEPANRSQDDGNPVIHVRAHKFSALVDKFKVHDGTGKNSVGKAKSKPRNHLDLGKNGLNSRGCEVISTG